MALSAHEGITDVYWSVSSDPSLWFTLSHVRELKLGLGGQLIFLFLVLIFHHTIIIPINNHTNNIPYTVL